MLPVAITRPPVAKLPPVMLPVACMVVVVDTAVNCTVALVATFCPILNVTLPVAALTVTPVPAMAAVTPVLVKVIELPSATVPEPVSPIP